jgi:hypothetical protein
MNNEHILETDGFNTPLFIKGITGGFKKNQPSLKIGSSRGTLAFPENCQNGDQIGVLKFTAYSKGGKDASYVNAAFVSAVVTEDVKDGQDTIDAKLILGATNGIFTDEYVSIDSKGVISAKGIKIVNNNNAVEERDKTKDWWKSNGCKFDYPVPLTIDTKSTGILIIQQENFKQPALRFDSYDNNPYKAGWTAFNRFRGTPEDPQPLKNGDFIYAFDWLGKAGDDPWEWGMAQTATVDGDPVSGFLPTAMNWVTRLSPGARPEVKVKLSNSGKLYAYYGVKIEKDLEVCLDEVKVENINFDDIKYIKITVNGIPRAIPAYSILG